MVAPDCFLIHIDHNADKKSRTRTTALQMKKKFDQYLLYKYGTDTTPFFINQRNGHVKSPGLKKFQKKKREELALPGMTMIRDKEHDGHNEQQPHYLLQQEQEPELVLPPVVTGQGTFWERSYFRANEESCPSFKYGKPMMLTQFESGFAAGPIIPPCREGLICDKNELLRSTFAFHSLLANTGLHFHLPVQPFGSRSAIVWDRQRLGSATGACFMGENYLAVASFGQRKLYVYEYDMYAKTTSLVAESRVDGEPELVDCQADGRIIVSCLHEGAPELFHFDSDQVAIKKLKTVKMFDGLKQWNHDVEFYPYSKLSKSVIIACTTNQHIRKSLLVRLYDYEMKMTIADFVMDDHAITKGYKPKGHRFVDNGRHMLLAVSKYVVRGYKPGCYQFKPDQKRDTLSGLVLLHLNFDVDDILAGRSPTASTKDFTVVQFIDLGISSPDGVGYKDGMALVVDQLNDKLFRVEVSGSKMKLLKDLDGYLLPHGIALSKYNNHFAVTCYGDNSVSIHHGLNSTISHVAAD